MVVTPRPWARVDPMSESEWDQWDRRWNRQRRKDIAIGVIAFIILVACLCYKAT